MTNFIIPIQVQDEPSLYSPFDPSGLSLSEELTAYLNDYVEDRRLGEKVCFELHTRGEIGAERFRKACLVYLQKLQKRNKREIVKCSAGALRLLLIGVAFILLGLVLAPKLNEVLAAIVSTIGSFSVWEASAQWIEVLPALRKKDRILTLLSDAEFKILRE